MEWLAYMRGVVEDAMCTCKELWRGEVKTVRLSPDMDAILALDYPQHEEKGETE